MASPYSRVLTPAHPIVPERRSCCDGRANRPGWDGFLELFVAVRGGDVARAQEMDVVGDRAGEDCHGGEAAERRAGRCPRALESEAHLPEQVALEVACDLARVAANGAAGLNQSERRWGGGRAWQRPEGGEEQEPRSGHGRDRGGEQVPSGEGAPGAQRRLQQKRGATLPGSHVVAVVVALLGAGAGLSGVAGLDAQALGPRYHPLFLDCAVYRQRIASEIELESGPNRSRERAGREGILVVRAAAQDALIRLEAWFDSLAVWREGSGVRTVPETDGVIGGRFRGALTALGAYRSEESPFVPDDVAAVSDVAGALADFFPPLPERALAVGETLQAEQGWRITRLGDEVSEGRRMARYRLERSLEAEAAGRFADSTPVEARRTETEAGVLQWDPERGLVRWERTIRATAAVPAGPGVPRAFRTAIRQRVLVERMPGLGRDCTAEP